MGRARWGLSSSSVRPVKISSGRVELGPGGAERNENNPFFSVIRRDFFFRSCSLAFFLSDEEEIGRDCCLALLVGKKCRKVKACLRRYAKYVWAGRAEGLIWITKGRGFHIGGSSPESFGHYCGISGWLHNCSNVSILDLEVTSSEDSNSHKREVSHISMVHYEASADFTTQNETPILGHQRHSSCTPGTRYMLS